jgi:RNA polymerase sigma-70 factor (ECF subfamily)
MSRRISHPRPAPVHDRRFMERPVSADDESRTLRRAIARAKEGDMGALHFLYLCFADDVRRYIASILGDPHEAEDVTQDIFAKLLTKIQRYEPRDVPFAAWIVRVARNAALDHMRAPRALPVEEVRGSDEGKEQGGHERAEILRLALTEVPADQRQVLVLRHVAGLSPSEIAVRLGKTESSIHGLHHRGREAIKGALRELELLPATSR